MAKLVQILMLVLSLAVCLVCVWAAAETGPAVPTPKLVDFAVNGGDERDAEAAPNAGTESRVTISVGETNGFYYTVNGVTYSPFRIAVSGEYYNNELLYNGYARLFMGVDSGIYYYWIQPRAERVLEVYVQNFAGAEFFFQVLSPYPVSSLDLRGGQYNATAIIVTGPSRSQVHYPRAGQAKFGKAFEKTAAKHESDLQA